MRDTPFPVVRAERGGDEQCLWPWLFRCCWRSAPTSAKHLKIRPDALRRPTSRFSGGASRPSAGTGCWAARW